LHLEHHRDRRRGGGAAAGAADVTVMLLAVASLVIPGRRQRYLLAVLDRLVKIATALRGSSK